VLLDGAVGDAKHLRDLGMAELEDLAQHKYPSAQRWQSIHRSAKRLESATGVKLLIRRYLLRVDA
jgi:hypothetical protein